MPIQCIRHKVQFLQPVKILKKYGTSPVSLKKIKQLPKQQPSNKSSIKEASAKIRFNCPGRWSKFSVISFVLVCKVIDYFL